jgi:hypothetical protein
MNKPTGKNRIRLWVINIFAEITGMLTQKEKDFMRYWEQNKDKEGHLSHQLLAGLPLGLCFGLPILVCFLFRSWYKWLPYVSDEEVLFISLAVLGIVLFYAVFRQKFLWERKEQQYLELKAKGIKEGDIIV